jgi:hypothetical protein
MRLELYELENALGKKVAKASSSCKFIMNVSDLSKQRGGK